jgi:diguanylate cyclase (GGDEF)-like protein
LLLFQNKILEMIATGVSLDVTAERLCHEIELLLPGVACSVLRVEDSGLLYPLAAPSLPARFSELIKGLMIGPNIGSCGSAAYRREAVVVTDIGEDPRWSDFKEHVLPHGFKACWSVPIYNAKGRVFGTFALYFKQKRMPRPREKRLVSASIHLCAIALEGHDRVLERERRASVDALTDLPNRSSFDAALSRLSCDEPGTWALLVIDLDNLKTINDTFGHQAGDELLQSAARRIRMAVRPDHVFRLGGDEFAVIVQATGALADLGGIAARILDAIGIVTSCCGHMIQPRATIGGAALTPGDHDAETVHRHADFALYHAKETGRGGFVRYWPGIGTAIKDRIEVIQDVDNALSEGRIEAYYQPVVRLDTGEIVGMEALCRLRKPEGNIVSAGAFHQATTDVDVAAKLTQGMLALVAADVRAWLEAGIPFQHVGINISSADFHSGTLYDRIKAAFGLENVPLKHVVLEVTESVYLGQNDPVVAQEIKALRAHGLRIALDDFGTGFASLTHLLTVPVDIIKIDKSFVSQLRLGDRGMAIIEGVLGIARKLNIRVIAEGVETEEQARLLSEIGCELGQGYLFSAAVTRESATELLLKHAQQVGFDKQPPIYGPPQRSIAGRLVPKPGGLPKKGVKPVSRDPDYVAPALRAL